MTYPNSTIESIKPVIEESKHVFVDKKIITYTLSNSTFIETDHWMKHYPGKLSSLQDDEILPLLFIFNSISFCYWGNPKWEIEHNGKSYNRGTWNMIAALERGIEENKSILDPSYIADMDRESLAHILRGNTEIQLLDQRTAILNEVGNTIKRYGNFEKFIEKANGSATRLLDMIIEEIPSFYDTRIYNNEEVYFHKRAQLLVSDLSQIIPLKNTDELTACADYKLPQELEYLNMIEYSPALKNKIKDGKIIEKGSQEEIEIRASTIHAVDIIKNYLNIPAMRINDSIWNLSGSIHESNPYHKTLTTDY